MPAAEHILACLLFYAAKRSQNSISSSTEPGSGFAIGCCCVQDHTPPYAHVQNFAATDPIYRLSGVQNSLLETRALLYLSGAGKLDCRLYAKLCFA